MKCEGMKLTNKILPRTLWFADYDGSLCPHLEVWEPRNYDSQQIFSVLESLQSASLGVFWNTGRRPESLGGVNADYLKLPGYFIHGTVYHDPTKGDAVQSPLLAAETTKHFQEQLENSKKFNLEIKATSLRVAPVKIQYLDLLKEWVGLHPASSGWEWRVGHRGVELLPVGFSKAISLTKELARHPKALPVAIGDEILDRPAIELALKHGGWAILVGESCGWITEVPHKPDQLIICQEPSDVLRVLQSLLKK